MKVSTFFKNISAVAITLSIFASSASAQIEADLSKRLQALIERTPTMVPVALDFNDPEDAALIQGLAAALPLEDASRASLQATLSKAAQLSGTTSDQLRQIQAVDLDSDRKQYRLGPVTSVLDIQARNNTIAVNGVVSIAAPPLKCFGIIGLSPDEAFKSVQFEFVEQHFGCPNMQLRAEMPLSKMTQARVEDETPAAFTMSIAEYSDGEVVAYADGSDVTTAIEYNMSSAWPPQDPQGDVIKVCVYRNQADCSYHYDRSESLLFKIQGAAAIKGDAEKFDPTYPATANTLIQRQNGGGCYMFDVDLSKATGLDVSYSQADKKVAWFINNIQMYNPDSCLNGQVPVHYYFDLNIKTTGTPVSGVQSIYVATPHYLSTKPNLELKPMEVAWGCVAGGTMVLLADGSEHAIEALKPGMQIALDPTRARFATLQEVTTGREPHPMIVVFTADGQRLEMTKDHPVPMGGEILAASELDVGMMLNGLETTEIVAIEEGKVDAEIYNLVLGTDAEKQELGGEELTFVANGLVVGDVEMQRQLGLSRLPAPPPILARVSGVLQSAVSESDG